MLSLNICYPKIALVVWFRMTKTVYFQPGCMYRVRVKIGDSNPHIERASPSFIDIQVRIMIVLFFSFSFIYLFCFCCHNLFLNILLTTFNTVHNLLTIYKIPIIKMFNTHLRANYSNVILTRQQTNF